MLNIQKIINEPLTFEAAVEYFKGKVPVTKDEFDSLLSQYKTKAFTVSGYTSLEVIKKFMDEIEKALNEGLTIEDFKKRMNDFLERKGYKGITPYQADNIFRTNIQTAYNVGHYRRMTQPSVLKARPYWMYDAVNDSKTRPTHLAMDGKVFPANHKVWDTWYPPNGYRCRCGVRSLSERQVKAMGLKVETEVPKMAETKIYDPSKGKMVKSILIPLAVDPGFSTNPAKTDWKPDLSKYPKVLRDAYKNRK
ncbi:phage minor head protein [Caloranaerobacter sp. DY30410]|uniref:phage head morphogenesis protein n=1 Tax=Caloranaerobacter sp. DY30410 TaxID=3238305 RepID=UPI003D050F68